MNVFLVFYSAYGYLTCKATAVIEGLRVVAGARVPGQRDLHVLAPQPVPVRVLAHRVARVSRKWSA